MKTIIKIAIAVIIIVGCVNVGRALMTEYKFEDAVHEALLFNPRMTDKEIIAMVLDTAQNFDVPMEVGNIRIRDQGPDVIVEMSYTTMVIVFPRLLEKEWTFTPSATTRNLVGGKRRAS